MFRRSLIRTSLLALCALGNVSLVSAQGIPILVYHRFDSAKADEKTVRTSKFEDQLSWLREHHYHVVPLQKAVEDLLGTATLEEPAVAITVDDDHALVYLEMWPVIVKYGIPVTLFIHPSAISSAPDALTWEQLHIMQQFGLVDIESNTYSRPNFRKERARLPLDEYNAFVAIQLTLSRAILRSRTGKPVEMLAWPSGIVGVQLEEAAAQAGYTSAFADGGRPARPNCDLFAIPRIPVSDEDEETRFAKLLAGSSK